MKGTSPKLLLSVAFAGIFIILMIINFRVSNDLKETIAQAQDEMLVSNMLNHLDKLNTAITFIERNEKPHLIAKNRIKAAEIEIGDSIAKSELDSLKYTCDDKYFLCRDIASLDSIMKEKIRFSNIIIGFSKRGQPDSAIQFLLKNNKDSLIIYGFINKYNSIYDLGREFVLNFQNKHLVETQKNAILFRILIWGGLFFTMIIFWRLLDQISKREKLAIQNQIYADIIETSFDSITITDNDHHLTYCNKATEDFYKRDRSEMLNKQVEDVLVSMESAPEMRERIHEIETKGKWTGEVERKDAEGHSVFLQLSINSLKDKDGEKIGHAAIAANITSLKTYQKEIEILADSLKNVNEHLEIRVSAQTAIIKEVFERVKDIFIGTDKDLNISYASSNVDFLFRLQDKEITGSGISEILYKITGKENIQLVHDSFHDQHTNAFEFLHPITGRYFECNIFPSQQGVSLFFKDITTAKKAKEEIEKSNRFYAFISNSNELILHAVNQDEILKGICKMAVDIGKFHFVWIGIKDPENGIVKPIFWSGYDAGYLKVIKPISLEDNESGRGPTGKAIREGRYYYCNDIEIDPAMTLWRNEALLRGYRSSITLPINVNEETIAVMAIYAAESFRFSDEEIQLLLEITENMSFAINAFRLKAAKNESESQLHKVLQAVEQSFASIVITDLAGNIEYVNPAFSKVTGYSYEEAIGQNPRILKSGYTPEKEYANLWQKLTNKKPWQGEFQNRKKNGETYWEYAVISPIVNEAGEITNYVAVKENITERKELAEKQKELAAIIETTTAYVGMADINNNIIYLNKEFKKALEISDEEDVSKYSIQQFNVSGELVFEEQFKYLNETGKWLGENIMKSKSGKEFPVLQAIVMHKNERGEPVHISTTAIDLSKIKEAESELLRVNNQLQDFARHLQNISEIEKKEIARDIHDELGQNLTALNLRVSWMKAHLGDDKGTMEKRFDDLLEEIKETMAAFRRIHSSLHPAMLEDLGLDAAINWLINSVRQSSQIHVEYYSDIDNKAINFDKALPVYRLVQESLTNIMRYSKASVVSVSLVQDENTITLNIEDNGCGFDVSKVDSKEHHGILGMRERVYAINGKFEINSVIGEGTSINVSFSI